MVKAWCIWCETGDALGAHGYFWIHEKCAYKMMDSVHDNLISIKKMLEGIHVRNKEDENKLNVICKFLQDMENFDRQWNGTLEIIKKITGEKELAEVPNSSQG